VLRGPGGSGDMTESLAGFDARRGGIDAADRAPPAPPIHRDLDRCLICVIGIRNRDMVNN
jgi:hypothetical protein